MAVPKAELRHLEIQNRNMINSASNVKRAEGLPVRIYAAADIGKPEGSRQWTRDKPQGVGDEKMPRNRLNTGQSTGLWVTVHGCGSDRALVEGIEEFGIGGQGEQGPAISVDVV